MHAVPWRHAQLDPRLLVPVETMCRTSYALTRRIENKTRSAQRHRRHREVSAATRSRDDNSSQSKQYVVLARAVCAISRTYQPACNQCVTAFANLRA
jgi:hypothetical protein